jgi:hypothetical protein
LQAEIHIRKAHSRAEKNRTGYCPKRHGFFDCGKATASHSSDRKIIHDEFVGENKLDVLFVRDCMCVYASGWVGRDSGGRHEGMGEKEKRERGGWKRGRGRERRRRRLSLVKLSCMGVTHWPESVV